MPTATHYISTAEAAQRLGVSVRTVRNYITAGRLPASRLSARATRIAEHDLDAFISASRTPDEDAAARAAALRDLPDDEYFATLAAEAPPLTDEQRARLVAILSPAARGAAR